MTVTLAAIVRDEEARVGTMIRSALPLIDRAVIIDTGSTDRTEEAVREAVGDIPLMWGSSEWVGFDHNRSELMAAASDEDGYLLLLDADMTIHHPGPLPELTKDVYEGRIVGSAFEWDLPILVRSDRDWRYEGVAHSYLTCTGGIERERIPGLEITHTGNTGVNKLLRDLELLSAEHARDPLDARTAFYLAQTYRDLGMIPEAIAAYRYRANLQGWDEETFYARYRLGCLLCEHVSFKEGARELLAAWEMRPSRIEPLRALAGSATSVANKAAFPDADRLFVRRAAYTPPVNRWQKWRADYDNLDFAGQQRTYADLFVSHRDQARYDKAALARVLRQHPKVRTVVELGGWDGGFANEILPLFPDLESWTNHEISADAVAASVCIDPRYTPVTLTDWYWTESHQADLFVASHVIEHLKFADVRKVFDATDADILYLQAPLAEGPTDWSNYHGTHILEVGWAGITEEFEKRGYRLDTSLNRSNVRVYVR